MNYCLSGDPYCAKNPASRGTYEAYRGSLCGECEEEQQRQAEEAARELEDPDGDD